ncbi:MAG: hypothetical protein IJR83_00365, partial [Clostridia bacterium]|nr:hypothetical protein [Clostridia bacterium]
MKKYLAIDSGGSKTAAILYDEDLNRLAVTTAGRMRTNTTADDLYEKHLQDLVGSLGLEGETIEQISGVCESRVTDRIKTISNVKSVEIVGEHELGFPAAGVLGDGILALCGTGATVFARYQGQSFSLGGYGAAVSDEGSGYYIGRKAYNAAIRDYEGRGPRTQLTQMLVERLGFFTRDQLRGAIFSIYANADRSPVATVASFVPDVVRAASLGDAEAQRIL